MWDSVCSTCIKHLEEIHNKEVFKCPDWMVKVKSSGKENKALYPKVDTKEKGITDDPLKEFKIYI